MEKARGKGNKDAGGSKGAQRRSLSLAPSMLVYRFRRVCYFREVRYA